MEVRHLRYFLLPLVPLLVALAPGLVPTGCCEERRICLADALKIGLAENYELRAEKNALLARKEGVGIARSFLLPKLVFEERATRTNNPPQTFMMKLNQQRFTENDFAVKSLNEPQPVNDYQTAFFIEQPLFSMRSMVGLSMARNEFAAKTGDYERKKEETALKIVRAYIQARTARAYVRAALDGIEDAREHVRIAEVRHRNNLGLYSDLLRAQVALAENRQTLVSAEKEYTVAKRWLGLVLAKSEPIDPADENLSWALKDIGHYEKTSLSRKDLRAMTIRKENAHQNVKLAKSAYLPFVGIGGVYQANDHNNVFGSEGDSWGVSAFLRWELFDGTKREFEQSKARYEEAEAGEHLKTLRDTITFRVNEAYLAVGEAGKNLELARDVLKSAEEGLRLVRSRFENSLSPIVDLLDVQTHVSRARAAVVARDSAYNLAVVTLAYESGAILQELNIE